MAKDRQLSGMQVAATLATALLCSLAQATECEGTVKLAGGDMGCRIYDNDLLWVNTQKCGFKRTPVIKINTYPGVVQDYVAVRVTSKNKDDFSVLVTTIGLQGNMVCANTSFSWSAKD